MGGVGWGWYYKLCNVLKYLVAPHFHSSVHKAIKHFSYNFASDTPKIWNDQLDNIQNLIEFNLCLFQKQA